LESKKRRKRVKKIFEHIEQQGSTLSVHGLYNHLLFTIVDCDGHVSRSSYIEYTDVKTLLFTLLKEIADQDQFIVEDLNEMTKAVTGFSLGELAWKHTEEKDHNDKE
jgi:hypothetical protein